MEKGTLVKMTEEFKKKLILNGSHEHVEEFGECVGVIEGPSYPNEEGNEFDVRWEPSKLKDGYPHNGLEKV